MIPHYEEDPHHITVFNARWGILYVLDTWWCIYASSSHVIIRSGSGLLPVRWTRFDLLLIVPVMKLYRNKKIFVTRKYCLQPFCSGLNLMSMYCFKLLSISLIARFMGPTWGPSGTSKLSLWEEKYCTTIVIWYWTRTVISLIVRLSLSSCELFDEIKFSCQI